MNFKKMLIVSLVLALSLGTALIGCSGQQTSEKPSEEKSESANTGSAEVKEIKIGVVYPLTGSMANAGQDQKKGVEFGAKLINESFDLNIPLAQTEGLPNLGGAKIKLVFADTQGDPKTALGEAERLITEEKVVALIGSYASSNTAGSSQAAERHGIPFLNAESTQHALTDRGFKWFFRTIPHDYSFTQNLFKFYDELETQKGIKVETIASAYENSQFGQGSNEAQKHFASETGRTIVADIAYPKEITDATSEVLKIKNTNPDVMMMASYINDAILFQKTLKEQNFLPKAIIGMEAGHVDKDYVGVLGKDASYVMTSATWSADLINSKPIVAEVNQIFKEEYGTDLYGYIPHAITGMLVLADAIDRAGSTDPAAIQQALLATDYPGDSLIMPWSGVKFDPNTHQNMYGTNVLLQIGEDGKYHVVWPFDVASAELVWPLPPFDQR